MELTALRAGAVGVLLGLVLAVGIIGGHERWGPTDQLLDAG